MTFVIIALIAIGCAVVVYSVIRAIKSSFNDLDTIMYAYIGNAVVIIGMLISGLL